MSVAGEVPTEPPSLIAALQDETLGLDERLGKDPVKSKQFLESLTAISVHGSTSTQPVPDLFDAPPLIEVESLLIVPDLGEIREVDRLFRFIKTATVRIVPEYIGVSEAMTTQEREKCVTLESTTTGAKVSCFIFARVEKGVSNLACLHLRRKLEHAFLEESQAGPKAFRDIYRSLCGRFLDALRAGHTYPDLAKDEVLAPYDWSSLQGSKVKCKKNAATNNSSSSTDGSNDGSNGNDNPAENDGNRESPASEENNSDMVAGQGDGDSQNSDSGRSSSRKQKKNKRKKPSDGESSTSTELSTGKGKKKSRKRKRFETSSESDVSQASKGNKRKKSRPAEDPNQPSTSKAARAALKKAAEGRTKKGKKKFYPLMKKPKCCAACKCWSYGRDKIMENYSKDLNKAQKAHMALIHEHLCHKSLFDKLTSETRELNLIRTSMEAQERKLDTIVEYTKVSANEKKFNQQREKDLAELNLPFHTNTDFLEAVDNKFNILVRAMAYFGFDEQSGEGFFANYLKGIMHSSLLYRMYTSKSKGKKSVSGKLFVYGCEYFRLPKKFEDALVHYAEDRWPSHFPKGKRASKRVYSLLEHYRKIRSTQMRNLLCYKTKDEDSHDLYRMIWWDNELCLKSAFDRPAPLWTDDKETQDTYVKKFKRAWRKQVRGHTGLREWKSELPIYNFDPSDSTAEKLIMAPQATPEPYWTFIE